MIKGHRHNIYISASLLLFFQLCSVFFGVFKKWKIGRDCWCYFVFSYDCFMSLISLALPGFLLLFFLSLSLSHFHLLFYMPLVTLFIYLFYFFFCGLIIGNTFWSVTLGINSLTIYLVTNLIYHNVGFFFFLYFIYFISFYLLFFCFVCIVGNHYVWFFFGKV